jgi:hypothetical protein
MSSTLLDVATLTDLDVTTLVNLFDLLVNVSHDIPTSHKHGIVGWKGYINKYSESSGHVSDKENIVFLMMLVEHFFFCGPTIGPCSNIQGPTELLFVGSYLLHVRSSAIV